MIFVCIGLSLPPRGALVENIFEFPASKLTTLDFTFLSPPRPPPGAPLVLTLIDIPTIYENTVYA